MNRVDIDNLLRIGVIILLVAVPSMAELEQTDNIYLNDTFVKINNSETGIIRLYLGKTIVENFESEYGGLRTEDMSLGIGSIYWKDYPTDSNFKLELPTTEGNEWQNGNTVGNFSDESAEAYATIQRLPRKDYSGNVLYGNASNNDYWEYSVYNITGSGTYGCMQMVSEPTGNGLAIHVIKDGYLLAVDDTTPTPLIEILQGVWYTIRTTTIMPNKYNLTINGITYGEFLNYNQVNWDYNEEGTGYVEKLALGTFALLVEDTCSFIIDNVTNSWEGRGEIVISREQQRKYNGQVVTIDYPAIYMDFGYEDVYINTGLWGTRYE